MKNVPNPRLKGKKVLVPGGTGAMGVYLVELLQQSGATVYVTTRRNIEGGSVKYLQGNAHELKFMRRCVKETEPDVIVDFMSYKTQEFHERAEFLANAAAQYVFLSSYRVFNDAPLITEKTPRLLDTCDDKAFLETDLYPLAKARQEDILRKTSGNWTLVRPCITYSKERFQFGCLEANTVCYRAFRNLPVVMPNEMLDKATTMTWGGDVAEMILGLLLNSAAYRDDFNVVTSESHTWREVLGYYSDLIGLRAIEVALGDYERIIGSHYHYQVIYDRMFNRRCDNSKILSATGLRQSDFMKLEDGLALELDYFRKHEYYGFLNVPENARMDAYCGCRRDLKGMSEEDVSSYNAAVEEWRNGKE